MDLLSSWLSQCRNNHKACSDSSEVTLPTRVISVGSETTLPRLYVPEEGIRGQYAALSHCWGGGVLLKTTTTNIEEHQHGIPEDRLPKTFLDAIYIARKLRIPFLWIDSLCIMQDAHEDWARESGRMGSYYSGAILTIAADCAADSSKGCLKGRPGEAWNSVRIEKHQSGLRNDVHVRIAPRESREGLGHTFKPRAKPNDLLPESHLKKRAWALQEWFLSRRIVHFTDEEMVWECQQESLCECSTEDETHRFREVRKTPFKSLVEDFPALYEQWMGIVREFSKRSITHETDRLPAISGVAEVFSKETKDEYVCGVWKNCPATLIWSPDLTAGLTLRQDKFYAPSWSWASIATPIRKTYLREKENGDYCTLAEVLDIDSAPETTNRFGPVKKYAKLTIRGHVFPGRCRELAPGGGYYYNHHFFIGKRRSGGYIRLDFPQMPSNTPLPGDITLVDISRLEPDLHPGDKFIVLIIYRKGRYTDGLVLKAVDESASMYQRVGTYSGEYLGPGVPEWDHSEERTITLV